MKKKVKIPSRLFALIIFILTIGLYLIVGSFLQFGH